MLRRLTWCLLAALPVGPLLAQSRPPLTPGAPAPVADTTATASFWAGQLQFARVREAQAVVGERVTALLVNHAIDPRRPELFLRLVKTNRRLEV